MDFVEKVTEGGAKTVDAWAATVKACWINACTHDGISPADRFAVFTEGNPHVPYYEKALRQYREAASQFIAGGYVGLSIESGKGTLPTFRKRKAK